MDGLVIASRDDNDGDNDMMMSPPSRSGEECLPALIRRLPEFDQQWSDDVKIEWLRAYSTLVNCA